MDYIINIPSVLFRVHSQGSTSIYEYPIFASSNFCNDRHDFLTIYLTIVKFRSNIRYVTIDGQ